MKKFLICLLAITTLLPCTLSSCSKVLRKADEYIVTYPENYTVDYCNENYIEADPNLLYLRVADNDIGRIEIPGGGARYRAIKDVPLDEYLMFDESIMFAPLSYKILKNKNNLDLPQQEILSYKIKDIKIYRQTYDTEIEPVDKYKLGAKMVEEELSSISGEKTDAFQAHIIECLEQGNYHKNYGKQYGYVFNPNIVRSNDRKVRLRVTFENYENLVWDTTIYEKKNKFYIDFYTPSDSPDGGWLPNYIPLDEEFNEKIAELIP